MLMIPTSRSPSLTGTWRTRRIVISFMTSVTLSSGEQTATAFVINSEIGIVGNLPPYVARPYARSRSETMPSIEFPSLLTTRAPICSARICPESRSAVSCGGTVFTTDPLMRKISATFMAGSNVHELSKPLSYRGLCSYDATYMVRNFNFVALVDPVHLRGQIKEDRMVNLTAHPLGP